MIEHLRHMAIFARVVDEGSFRAAAKAIGLAPSRVSETVSDLESYLGVTLLYRTTRKIALTNEGRMFYARVAEMLRSAEIGLNELNALSLEPVGALRVSMPAFMSTSALATAIAEFVQQHPQVAISVSYTDERKDLLEDGFDVNIRVGWLDDSSMMSRKLGESDRALVAGAKYASIRPQPTHPSDLESWDWLRYKYRPDHTTLQGPKGETVKVLGQARLEVDSIDALHHFTCQNLGVTVLPEHLAARGEAKGELVRLMPDWGLIPIGFFAVWPDTSRRESLTLLFVRFVAERYGSWQKAKSS
ncbi:LysR family transcriptional regulator [Sulfitobacter geojensis]|uniref:LysR family transcriptional regulator n=1 Tax=Sulfitobacter geojensis TaxID=1342299 RepID=A0AAE2W1D8_9RHOB|nr:LysR family transcriptional regulator [Sulfitobacter geojensis]MBM1690637.1 LysR family transcriptional regulator [Sulfitobacter geojensis]MBM1694703.1 LysR family transcriptional regulator [Sulfitobacter geojensis]MBM1707591.1 LysR family transcriptional regulator [Sulfitobacter geojensis]MBM1711201.1 LysR family transcriptional regulator [Sulfitobacter geojensis]MBM1715716.1 LysR family transcriptional regulator [Sulfitobacter geojensis]